MLPECIERLMPSKAENKVAIPVLYTKQVNKIKNTQIARQTNGDKKLQTPVPNTAIKMDMDKVSSKLSLYFKPFSFRALIAIIAIIESATVNILVKSRFSREKSIAVSPRKIKPSNPTIK